MTILAPPVDPAALPGLRVFSGETPAIPAPPSRSCRVPAAFDRFDRAFQLATGWKLGWNPDPQATDRITVEDLSAIYPPGMPAVGRTYCDHLIACLNRLMADSRLTADLPPADHRPSGRTDLASASNEHLTPASIVDPGPTTNPCIVDQFGMVPLVVRQPSGTAEGPRCGFQWRVQDDGNLLATAFQVDGSPELLASACLTARTSFLAAARLGGGCEPVHEQIGNGIEHLFAGDVRIISLVWCLDPLSGRACLFGDHPFEVYLGQQRLLAEPGARHSFSWYRNQILLVSLWATESAETDPEDRAWTETALKSLPAWPVARWQERLAETVERRIPSIRRMPETSLAMIRYPSQPLGPGQPTA